VTRSRDFGREPHREAQVARHERELADDDEIEHRHRQILAMSRAERLARLWYADELRLGRERGEITDDEWREIVEIRARMGRPL